MQPLLRLFYLSASQVPVDGRWSLGIISPSFHSWGIIEQSRIKIEWLKVNCFKIHSTYHELYSVIDCEKFMIVGRLSPTCIRTVCKKLEPGRCSGLLNPEY